MILSGSKTCLHRFPQNQVSCGDNLVAEMQSQQALTAGEGGVVLAVELYLFFWMHITISFVRLQSHTLLLSINEIKEGEVLWKIVG